LGSDARAVIVLESGLVDSMTVGEIEEIEELSGQPIGAIGQDNVPKGKVLRAIAFIVARRDDPDITWEDSRNLRVRFASAEEEGQTSPTVPASRRRGG
jgi:hypothetical protein